MAGGQPPQPGEASTHQSAVRCASPVRTPHHDPRGHPASSRWRPRSTGGSKTMRLAGHENHGVTRALAGCCTPGGPTVPRRAKSPRVCRADRAVARPTVPTGPSGLDRRCQSTGRRTPRPPTVPLRPTHQLAHSQAYRRRDVTRSGYAPRRPPIGTAIPVPRGVWLQAIVSTLSAAQDRSMVYGKRPAVTAMGSNVSADERVPFRFQFGLQTWFRWRMEELP